MKISSNVVGDSNDENNFHHKLLLTNTQVTKLRKDFANGLSANVKYCSWKYKLLKITQKLVKLKIKLLLIMTKVNILLLKNFTKVTSENFTARLKQTNLASKGDIANFVKKTDFDNKLKEVTSNENELNELSKKVKGISTKGLSKVLIIKFSIVNGAKYFSLEIFQNYLYLYRPKNTLSILVALAGLNRWNLMKCQKKELKI